MVTRFLVSHNTLLIINLNSVFQRNKASVLLAFGPSTWFNATWLSTWFNDGIRYTKLNCTNVADIEVVNRWFCHVLVVLALLIAQLCSIPYVLQSMKSRRKHKTVVQATIFGVVYIVQIVQRKMIGVECLLD